jgi:hypothetical protein
MEFFEKSLLQIVNLEKKENGGKMLVSFISLGLQFGSYFCTFYDPNQEIRTENSKGFFGSISIEFG